MNPGERDRNPFRNNGQGSTAKYFGGRSKYNDSRNSSRTSSYFTQQPAQTFYAAPAPQPERKKKPWVLIGAGAFLVVALIVGAIIVVSQGKNPLDFTPKSSNFAELQQTIEEARASLEYYDGAYLTVSSGSISYALPTDNKERINNTKKNLEEHLGKLSTLRTNLNKYENVKAFDYFGSEVEVDDLVNRLKTSLDKRLRFYNYYKQLITAILDFYENGYNVADIQKVKDICSDDKIVNDLKKVKRYAEIEKDATEKKCNSKNPNLSDECKELLYEWKDLRQTTFESDSLLNNLKKNLEETEDNPLSLANEIVSLKKAGK